MAALVKKVNKSFFHLFPQLANNLQPQEVRPGIQVATITGTLVTKDNRYTLEPLNLSEAELDNAK